MIRKTNKHDNAFLPPTARGEFPMTKRELFAAMAMQAMLSNDRGGRSESGYCTFDPESISILATLHADALINALNAEQ